MAKPDPRIDPTDRFWTRELIIVASIVGLIILAGAVYTLLRGPQPVVGAGGTGLGVEARTTESGALRPADAER